MSGQAEVAAPTQDCAPAHAAREPAGTHQALDTLKRRVILTILTASVLAGWLNMDLSSRLDVASILSMTSITEPLIVLALWPRTLRVVEYTMALLIAALFILMLVTAVGCDMQRLC